MVDCTPIGSYTSEKFCREFSPADSIARSPARSSRSKKVWLKNTVLMRSRGISIPDLRSTPDR